MTDNKQNTPIDENLQAVEVEEQLANEAQEAQQAENIQQDEGLEISDNEDQKDILIESLKTSMEALKAQCASEKNELLLALADAQNAKKRAEADVQKERKFAIESFVKALIPVVDSLDMALEHTNRDNPDLANTVQGIESTLNLFLKELANFGVQRIDPVGEVFDPNVHQAISMAPTDEVKPNCILSVMQKGFVLNGRVVRPAMVVVAKAKE